MYVLLMIGGPFLFFAAFDETRFIAKTWVKTFLNYALWLSLLALVMAIAIPGVIKAADGLANWDVVRDGVFTKQYALTLLFCGVVIYFLLKVSDLSAALTGGMGMQSSIAGGMIGGSIGAMGSAANAGGRGLMGMAGAGAANLAGMAGYAAGRAGGAVAAGAIRGFSALRGIK
jgi:type IV secretory pathway VirB6-like protein